MFSKIGVTAVTALCLLSGPALADWSSTVVSQGHTGPGADGQTDCPAGGTPGSIWGTGTYTSDSSICGAAQHYGWIPSGGGGTVIYRTVPGLQNYEGTAQNGVTSNGYGSWGLSFQITGYAPHTGAPVQPPANGGHLQQISWSDHPDGLGHGGVAGTTHQYNCPPSSAPAATIWGQDPYTSDSPVCVAAQHRGLINPANGGNVTVLILGSQPNYPSVQRYGVTSSEYPTWPRSYTFQQ